MADFGRLIIAGLPRSGTTLVATLLAAQPRIHFLTDYFPAFIDVRRRLDKPWRGELSTSEKRIALALVRDQFLRVRHPVLVNVDGFQSVDELHRQVLGELATGNEKWLGHKLLLGPDDLRATLADTEIHCLLLVRDVRDAALSYFHRTGGGVEYYVRNWRDTVRVARELERHPRLLILKFEDLIDSPDQALGRLGRWLELELDPRVSELHFVRSRAHGSTPWRENSAYQDVKGRFDRQPIGRWRSQADSPIVRYANWVAVNELEELGYAAAPGGFSLRECISFSCLRTLDRAEHRAHDSLNSTTRRIRRRLVRWGL